MMKRLQWQVGYMISFFVWTGVRTPINFHKHYFHKEERNELHSVPRYVWSNDSLPGGLFVNDCDVYIDMCVQSIY
eukprot:SAG31_NODE_640_length_13322_cov_4.396703_8_plen_75_part_00